MPNNLVDYLKKNTKGTALNSDGKFNFTCAEKCWGTCCIESNVGLLKLSVYDVYRLLKKRPDKDILELIQIKVEKDTNTPRAYMKWNKNGWCPNLEEDGKCKVYLDRPFSCRIFPLEAELYINDSTNEASIKYLVRDGLCYGFHKEANPKTQTLKSFLNHGNFDQYEKYEKLEVLTRDKWIKKYSFNKLKDEQIHKLSQVLYCLGSKIEGTNKYFFDIYTEMLKMPKRAGKVESFSPEKLTNYALKEFAPRMLEKLVKETN